jgi:hypothetical protein
LLFELSPDHAAVIRTRPKSVCPSQPLEGSPEPLAEGDARERRARNQMFNKKKRNLLINESILTPDIARNCR